MDVYIIGCGGNAKVVTEICEIINFNILGFFDDHYSGNVFCDNYRVLGTITDIKNYENIKVINSIGDCITRYNICDKINRLNANVEWVNCIHPNAYIAPSAILGKGNVICYGAVINAHANVGNFNLLNTYSVIEHDCIIGDYNHIAPRSTLCGNVRVLNYNLLGVGSSVIPGREIGNRNIIGAMSVIIKNIRDDETIIGVPGRKKTS